MACSKEKLEWIHCVIDGEASEQEVHGLDEHMAGCRPCKETYTALIQIDKDLFEFEQPDVPKDFTEGVMNRIETVLLTSKKRRASMWLKKHPLFISVACFIVLMLGYVFSITQDHSFQAKVAKGNGQLAYSGKHTVIIPKNEVIKGDVIVKNGDVKIEGKVDGNVILMNSHSLMASAGVVTGHVETVNRAVGWVWYQIKSLFEFVF